jgi:DUF438 domain-containing protein
MNEINQDKKKILKELIKQLHTGTSPQEIKRRFKHVLEGVSPLEIAKIEEELTNEGMPREELRKLCDVHLEVFKEQLEKQKMNIPSEHPINILVEEHRILLQLAERLLTITNKVQQTSSKDYADSEIAQILHITHDFQDAEKHYLREENVLFPILEKHGITEPPAMMWTEHDQIRERKKGLHELIQKYNTVDFGDFKEKLGEFAKALSEMLSNHFFKENNILFPAGLKVVAAEEWKTAREEFDGIGYCCFTPKQLTTKLPIEEVDMRTRKVETKPETGEGLQFEIGSLSKDEIESLLNSLPFDITFVDKDDNVKYFSNGKRRIFVRTKAIIGRKVQMCHPQKSIHIVNKIVDSFKAGKKDVAEFWIPVDSRLIHIRYFAVRDKDGKYLGTIEVTQDLTDIKKIDGEKRLLDWEA